MSVGIGIVGLGMASRPHIEALQGLKDSVTVVGVHSRTFAKAEKAAAEIGCEAHPTLEGLLAADGLDAVLVITPPNARTGIVAACAAAGKHVLAEKPVERTVGAAEEIVRTCERAGVLLGVVLQHRFRTDVRRLKEILDEGGLGAVGAARLDFPWWRDQDYYDEKGRGTYERDGGGVLISQAIHNLDVMLHLLGPVAEVRGFSATTSLHRMESEDFAAAGLRFESGAAGSVVATTAAFPGEPEGLHIDGELGSASLKANVLTLNWRDGRTETAGDSRGTGSGADPMAFGPELHRELIRDFADSVAEGREPAVSGASALQVQRLIEAILSSAKSSPATKVPKG